MPRDRIHPHDVVAEIVHPVPVPGSTRGGLTPTLAFAKARTRATIRHVPPEAIGVAEIGPATNPFRYARHADRLWQPIPSLRPYANGAMAPATMDDWLGGVPLPRFDNVLQPVASGRFQKLLSLSHPPFQARRSYPGLFDTTRAPAPGQAPPDDLASLCRELVLAAADRDLIHDGECLYVAIENPMLLVHSHRAVRHGIDAFRGNGHVEMDTPGFAHDEGAAYRAYLARWDTYPPHLPERIAEREADLVAAEAAISALGLASPPARDVELYAASALPATVDLLRGVVRGRGPAAAEARERMAAAWPWIARSSVGGPCGRDLHEALDRVRDLAAFVAERHPAAKPRETAARVVGYVTTYALPKLARLGMTRDADPETAAALAAFAP